MVPYEGPTNADIYLIGEAPGAHELKQHKPFVGPTGKLLNSLLASVGIARPTVRIANAICEAPGDLSNWILLGETKARLNKARKSSTTYIDDGDVLYTPRFASAMEALRDDIRSVQPKVIVPMGNIAMYAVTGHTQITKRRGSVYHFEHIPVVPTLHPSSCFHTYTNRYLLLSDLEKALNISKEGWTPLERSLLISPSYAETLSYLARCKQQSLLAFDIETVRTKKVDDFQDWEISCLSLAISATDAICIPFLDENRCNYFSEEQELQIWLALQDILLDRNITKLGQNIIFDLTFVKRKMGITLWPIHDTMILQALANPDFEKSLAFLCSVYSSEPYYKDEGKLHKTYGGATVERFWVYSAKDSAVLWEIYPKLAQEVLDLGNWPIYEDTLKMVAVLAEMQHRGMRADWQGLQNASAALDTYIQELKDKLNTLCGEAINPNSPDQVKQYFYGKKRERPYTKEGRPTVDEDALKRLLIKGYEEAGVLLEIRKWTKLKGTYIDVTLDEDRRLRSSFNPVGTITGRLSSSKTFFGTGNNMQNLPPDFKQFLLADPGYIIYELDLSQAENRIVAYIAPERKMIEAFESGLDVHSLTASLISGLTYEEVREAHKAGLPCPIGQGDKTWRYWGKTANHALNYGMSSRKLSLTYEIPLNDAELIRNRYHISYPGVRQYHSWAESEVKRTRRLSNVMGRTRVFLDRLDDPSDILAYIPQSTVATKINRHGLIPIYQDPFFKEVELLNQVHDSIIYQVPISLGLSFHWEVLQRVKANLEEPLTWRGLTFVIPAEAKAGKGLGKLKEVSSIENLSDLLTA